MYKATPPGKLPVEQMMRFELVVNLNTAKAPASGFQARLLRSSEVI